MQYSLFCQPGVCDGGAHVFPQVHRPPQDRCFLNGQGFARSSTENRQKEKQLRSVSGTNQNICFVKFTFTDCLVEFSIWENSTLTQITPGNRLRFTSQNRKVRFDLNKGAVSVTKRYNKPVITFLSECLYSLPPQDC